VGVGAGVGFSSTVEVFSTVGAGVEVETVETVGSVGLSPPQAAANNTANRATAAVSV
jgi:hypothetical protein